MAKSAMGFNRIQDLTVVRQTTSKSKNFTTAAKGKDRDAKKLPEASGMKFKMLQKFKNMVKDPPSVGIPVELTHLSKYKKCTQAEIIRVDHDRVVIIDQLLSNLYTLYLQLHDKSFFDAFVTCFSNFFLSRKFNEH